MSLKVLLKKTKQKSAFEKSTKGAQEREKPIYLQAAEKDLQMYLELNLKD